MFYLGVRNRKTPGISKSGWIVKSGMNIRGRCDQKRRKDRGEIVGDKDDIQRLFLRVNDRVPDKWTLSNYLEFFHIRVRWRCICNTKRIRQSVTRYVR